MNTQFIVDCLFEYLLAWILILLSPLWLPIWVAVRLHKWIELPLKEIDHDRQ